jgi:hypothetical protein
MIAHIPQFRGYEETRFFVIGHDRRGTLHCSVTEATLGTALAIFLFPRTR